MFLVSILGLFVCLDFDRPISSLYWVKSRLNRFKRKFKSICISCHEVFDFVFRSTEIKVMHIDQENVYFELSSKFIRHSGT